MISIQNFMLNQNGGGSRWLRRLHAGKEECIAYISMVDLISESITTAENEIVISRLHKWISEFRRSFVREIINSIISSKIFDEVFVSPKLTRYLKNNHCDILQIIDHGYLNLQKIFEDGQYQKLWGVFHDHYKTSGTPEEQTMLLWNTAHRRLVISQELGEEYNRLFGEKEFEIITDGIDETYEEKKVESVEGNITIYFGGLLHIGYYELLRNFLEGISDWSEGKLDIRLILRGTHKLLFDVPHNITVEYRESFVDENIIFNEIKESNILYLPIKFKPEEFGRYSMSTKMIGYLASNGAIFYHGPKDAAVANLLDKWKAAEICQSLEKDEIRVSLDSFWKKRNTYSENATKLAQNQFNMDEIRKRYFEEK